MNFVFAKKFQESSQLSDAQPFNDIDKFIDRRIGFVSECSRDDRFYASFSRGGGENFRINAVARDDSEKL